MTSLAVPTPPQYLIGIDLGTTNSTLSYLSLIDEQESHSPHDFPIEQLGKDEVMATLPTLPSALYLPLKGEEEIFKEALTHDEKGSFCVGAYARKRGGELPGRLVTSAKSWLCHGGVQRRSPLLPHLGEEGVVKRSPVEISAKILEHLRKGWDVAHPQAPLAEQKVLITVPASFDPSARELTLEAAHAAGLPSDLLLLEEPQAALYAWLAAHEVSWRNTLKPHDKVLIVDIGGGTTDFTLVSVEEEDGDLVLERLAVGEHLLLGGDNMDLSLAYLAKEKFAEQGHDLDEWQFQSLILACQEAKETLLAGTAPSVDLIIQGRGSRLIGGTLTVPLLAEEVLHVVLEGFFPLVSLETKPTAPPRSALRHVGLPYAQDPRVTGHLAAFLSRGGTMPTAILFNGGTMKAAPLRQRLIDQVNSWSATLGHAPLAILTVPSYDLAVSRGAAYYGLARQGKAIRIRGGLAHSYFVGIEGAMPAVPGIAPPITAICVAPLGMEEGTTLPLEGQKFSLALGTSALFRLFSRSTPTLPGGHTPMPGAVITRWQTELTELTPIEAHLEGKDTTEELVEVSLESTVTETGTFQLWCVAEDKRRWKLEFETRA